MSSQCGGLPLSCLAASGSFHEAGVEDIDERISLQIGTGIGRLRVLLDAD